MKNDKERREFVDDDLNWQIIDSTNNMQIRLRMLTYHDMRWIKVEAIHITERFDPKRRELIKEPRWVQLDMFDDHVSGVLGEHVSVTQIVNRIKDYDREHREGK